MHLFFFLFSLSLPARAGDCVFYLRPSRSGLEARLYDPGSDRDFSPSPPLVRASGVLWDRAYDRVWWLDGKQIRRSWWLGSGKPEPPIALPKDLQNPEAWWLGKDGVMLVRDRGETLELWQYEGDKNLWELFKHRKRSPSSFFKWSRRRTDFSLAAKLESMRAGAYLDRIEFKGGPRSGFFRFKGEPDCGLRLKVTTDAQGAHAALPLIHQCKGDKSSRILLAAPAGKGFAPVAFAESGKWLLVGREPAMDGARVLSLKDGSPRRILPQGASQAAWVSCPR